MEASEIARRFYERLDVMDIEGWADLWADDGRILVAYPPDGFAAAITGKEDILAGFRHLFGVYQRYESELLNVWQSRDIDVATVQYRVDADLVDGSHYTNNNVAIFETENDRIHTYHDYFDPRRFQLVVDAVQRPQLRGAPT